MICVCPSVVAKGSVDGHSHIPRRLFAAMEDHVNSTGRCRCARAGLWHVDKAELREAAGLGGELPLIEGTQRAGRDHSRLCEPSVNVLKDLFGLIVCAASNLALVDVGRPRCIAGVLRCRRNEGMARRHFIDVFEVLQWNAGRCVEVAGCGNSA